MHKILATFTIRFINHLMIVKILSFTVFDRSAPLAIKQFLYTNVIFWGVQLYCFLEHELQKEVLVPVKEALLDLTINQSESSGVINMTLVKHYTNYSKFSINNAM